MCKHWSRKSKSLKIGQNEINQNVKYRYSFQERYCIVAKSNNLELLSKRAQKASQLKCKRTKALGCELFISF